MHLLKTIFSIALVCSISALVACTSGGGDSDSSGGGDTDPGGSGSFRTDCGVVSGGELRNPIDASSGVAATVQITGPNQAIVNSGSARFLVKFQGLNNITDFRRNASIARLEQLAQQPAIFFAAQDDCTASVDGGGTAFVGQLFSASGRSYNETLISEGLARIDRSDACQGQLIGSCYDALEDSSEQLGGSVSNFLWKPEAERDGRLVVLLNPGGATIIANGETLAPSGASNGRGTTARGTRSGCGYGANVTVQAFDSRGRVLLFPGGARQFTIPNGCDRVEF